MQAVNQEDTKNILNYSAEDIGNAVMQQVLSYKKKIWLFNYLADIFRSHNNLKTALYLLRQALLLDDENEIVFEKSRISSVQKRRIQSRFVCFRRYNRKGFCRFRLNPSMSQLRK